MGVLCVPNRWGYCVLIVGESPALARLVELNLTRSPDD
jgi:hypothetical protein